MRETRQGASDSKPKLTVWDCEERSSHWLAEGNEAEARGNKAKAEKCFSKSQFWLDRANKLRGWN